MAGSPQQHDANYCGPLTVPPPMRERDHHTGDYVPYSLRTVCGFFNVPQNLYMQGLWDGAYGLSSLSEKTRKSNCLQMSLQRQHFLPWVLVRPGLEPAPPARKTGAYPTELTGRRLKWEISAPLPSWDSSPISVSYGKLQLGPLDRQGASFHISVLGLNGKIS